MSSLLLEKLGAVFGAEDFVGVLHLLLQWWSVVSFVHIFSNTDTDMSTLTWAKCIYPPEISWIFPRKMTAYIYIHYEIHVPIHHVWSLCRCLYILRVYSQNFPTYHPWSNRCNSLWRNSLYLEVWGWSTGVCSRSMSDFYRIFVFEWMNWNTWGQQHFSSCRRFRRFF